MDKPTPYTKAADAMRDMTSPDDCLVAVDTTVAHNDGFLLASPLGFLVCRDGQRWEVRCSDEKLWLERFEYEQEVS